MLTYTQRVNALQKNAVLVFRLVSTSFHQRKDLWLVLLFFLAAFLIYGRYVFTGSSTATGDFGPAVSYALNFKEAVHQGQWLPRWVVAAREMTLGAGSIDGTPVTPDSPAFQYYAFLQSALAYPLLLLKIPAIVAMQLLVVLAFAASSIALYTAGRVLGANRAVSFLSGYSYVISPWLVSNFYGRGGIAEAFGQSALPLLLLGYAFALQNKNNKAMLWVAVGVFTLALSHNVFLLYGVILCVLLALASLRWRPPVQACLFDFKIPLVLAAGVFIGLAASSWQWLPAVMTLKELSFYYIGSFSPMGKIPGNVADLSGAWGLPKQFLNGQVLSQFFFTIGWWTIPGILSVVLARPAQRGAALALFVSFSIFFFLTYWPEHSFPYLPSSFGATQFTFRLLAFLSVLGSFALCIGLPQLPRTVVLGLLIAVTLSQLPVIRFPMPKQKFPDQQYRGGYEYNNYYANSPREKNLRYWFDGWLDEENVLYLQDVKNKLVYLKIKGKTREGLNGTRLFVAPVGDPQHPVSNSVKVGKGAFEARLAIRKTAADLRLYATQYVQEGQRKLSIRPESVFLLREPPESFIPAADLKRIAAHGYQRVFVVNTTRLKAHRVPAGTLFTVELPMIYNHFVLAFQQGKPLPREIDFNHRLTVQTNNLTDPILVRYTLPLPIRLLSILGLSLFGIVLAFQFLSHKVLSTNKLKGA